MSVGQHGIYGHVYGLTEGLLHYQKQISSIPGFCSIDQKGMEEGPFPHTSGKGLSREAPLRGLQAGEGYPSLDLEARTELLR